MSHCVCSTVIHTCHVSLCVSCTVIHTCHVSLCVCSTVIHTCHVSLCVCSTVIHTCHVSLCVQYSDTYLSCLIVCVQYHAFSFITSILQSMGYSEAEKQELQDEALRHLEDLVSIDCRQAATTIISSLPASLPSVITRLKARENILFEFLQGIMAYRLVCVFFCCARPIIESSLKMSAADSASLSWPIGWFETKAPSL